MSEPAGTANILHQFAAYNELREDHSPEVANALTKKSLERHGINVTAEGVEGWHQINSAAVDSKLDIPAERRTAEMLADAAAAAMLNTAGSQSGVDSTETVDTVADADADADESEDERPSLSELYGYEDDEDNEEAAYDDVLKIQERAD